MFMFHTNQVTTFSTVGYLNFENMVSGRSPISSRNSVMSNDMALEALDPQRWAKWHGHPPSYTSPSFLKILLLTLLCFNIMTDALSDEYDTQFVHGSPLSTNPASMVSNMECAPLLLLTGMYMKLVTTCHTSADHCLSNIG
jgi:hypothetical protein